MKIVQRAVPCFLLSMLLLACDQDKHSPACSPQQKCFPVRFESDLGVKSRMVSWSYDAEGRLSQKHFSPISSYAFLHTDYYYDAQGRLLSIRRAGRGGAGEFLFEYDLQGKLVKRIGYDLVLTPATPPVVRQPSQYQVYEYNALGQRSKMQTYTQEGDSVYPYQTYLYDLQGNLSEVHLHEQQVSYRKVSYSYDDKNSMYAWEPDTGDSPIPFDERTIPTRDFYPRAPHNVTEEIYYDANGQVTVTNTFEYQYNEQCFPTQQVPVGPNYRGPAYAIQYNCN